MKKTTAIIFVMAMALCLLCGCSAERSASSLPEKSDIRIVPSEASQVQFVPYTDPSGCFTAEIPSGWAVTIGIPGDTAYDYISYAITVYDPQAPDRKVYLNLNTAGFAKSAAAQKWYQTYYANSPQALLPAVEPQTTAGFFSVMGNTFGYSGYAITSDLGKTALGGNLLLGTATSAKTGKRIKGLYTATVTSTVYPVLQNPFALGGATVDAGITTVFSVMIEQAGEDEYLDWQPILDRCLSGIRFTEQFNSQRATQWKQVMGTAQYLSQTADAMSDAIMDTWNTRNRSQDILSQKQSDATLGYERVYDTETGDIYKAYNGFSDQNRNERYRPITDEQYTDPVAGYIEK